MTTLLVCLQHHFKRLPSAMDSLSVWNAVYSHWSSGRLPTEIGNLSNLLEINLAENNLSGDSIQPASTTVATDHDVKFCCRPHPNTVWSSRQIGITEPLRELLDRHFVFLFFCFFIPCGWFRRIHRTLPVCLQAICHQSWVFFVTLRI